MGKYFFTWLAKSMKCVYLVFVDSLVADHFFLVSGARRLIIDSAERYQSEVNYVCLRMCGCLEETLLKCGDVR